ncbi:hypothetical protein [Amaricoccus sp.]|uniref:hypothetical protein n=1 Tax=Amaricoccus sp. TaxID=1872485 RepID=UPI003FA566C8
MDVIVNEVVATGRMVGATALLDEPGPPPRPRVHAAFDGVGMGIGFQFQGRIARCRESGAPAVRARTSASQTCGSTPSSLAVFLSVSMKAALSAPPHIPARARRILPRSA